MRRFSFLALIFLVFVAHPSSAHAQAEAAKKILSALKLQEIFRYRASKDYLKEGMRLADQANSQELWLAGAQLYAIALSLTADHQGALNITNEALERIARNPALKGNEETFLEFAGVLEFKVKRPQRALEHLEKLRKLQAARNDRKGELGTMHHQAYASAIAGDYPSSLSLLDTILSERSKLDPETVPQVLHTQAKFLQEIGEHKKALESLNEALALLDGLMKATPEPKEPSLDEHFKTLDQDPKFPERHKYRQMKANRAELLALQGSYFDFAGDYTTALARYQDAVDLEKSLMISGTRKDELFDIARRLIIIHRKLGNMKKAFDIIGAFKTLAEKNDIPTNDLELTYGEFLLAYINHPQYGADSTKKAIDIFERNDRPDLLGVVALKQKDYKRAKQQFSRALTKALYSREADKLVGTHMGAGLAAEGTNELEEAERYLTKAIALMENQRDTLSPADRAAFFSGEVIGLQRTAAYEALVRVYIKQQNLDAAFIASENIKARRLAEAIAAGRSVNASLPEAERAKEQALETKITQKVRELELAFKRKDNAAFTRIEGELTAARQERDVFVDGLRKTFTAYAAIRYPKPLPPPDLWLAPNEALIEFEVTDDELYAFVISNGQSRVVKKALSRDKLSAQVDEIRAAFQGVEKADDLARFDPDKAHALYRALFDGVLDGLPEKTRITVVPDEFLAVLPFDALVVEAKGKKMGQGEQGPFPLGVTYLGEKRLLRYAQSGTSLTIARALASTSLSKKLLVEADPVFSATDKRAQGAVASAQTSATASEWKKMGVAGTVTRAEAQTNAAQASSAPADVFPRLEKTSLLADRLRSLFGDDARIYTGKDAREATVKTGDLRDYRFLLFATHGILDDTLPYVREPALVLSLVDNPAGDDGFLTASEVMALKLDADVVALTACQTGVGKNVSGEGVMGLGRAFEFAGAKRVLMSLWEVSEDSTTLLASQFFDYMKKGQDAESALLDARKDVRRKGYENPFYWAAFTLMGAGERPVQRMAIAQNGPPKPVTKPEQTLSQVLTDLEKQAQEAKPPPPPPPPPPPSPFEVSAEYRADPTSLRNAPWDFGRMNGVGVAGGYHSVAGGHFLLLAPFISMQLDNKDVDLEVTLGAAVHLTIEDPQTAGVKAAAPRRRDWDEWRDYLKIVQSAEIRGRGVSLGVGRITEYELGSGSLMRGYQNNLLADHTRVGLHFNYDGEYGRFDAVLTDFGALTTLMGLYGGVKPLGLAGMKGIPGSIRVGLGWVGDVGAPTTFRTTDGLAIDTANIFYPVYDVRGVHGLSADLSITPVDFRFLRARVYSEFSQLVTLGNGVSAGIDINAPIPDTALSINARMEYRSLGSQYLPTYFDSFYEVQRLHFYSGDPITQQLTKAQFVGTLFRTERANSFWGDFSIGYGRWIGLGVTYETGGFATASSLTLHAQSQILSYLTLFFTYQKRNFGQNSEVFRFAENDLLSAYLRGQFTEWLQVYGRVSRTFSWDAALGAGAGRMAPVWDASVGLGIAYPAFKK